MSEAAETIEGPPAIELHQIGVAAEAAGEWEIRFLVTNRGAHGLKLISARLPHGQFRGPEIQFDTSASLAAGETLCFAARVRCHEPPGLVTENAFLIFLVEWRGGRWRVFARVRVTVDVDGIPEAVTASITTQKVGFSGLESQSVGS